MSAQTETRSEIRKENSNADTILGFAVLGLLAAGIVGIMKAMDMGSGFDVLLCLIGSVAAFGTIAYIFLAKH